MAKNTSFNFNNIFNVESMLETAEKNAKTFAGFITNDTAREITEAYFDASFATARLAVNTNTQVAEKLQTVFVK